MASPNDIGAAFCKHYYSLFDSGKTGIQQLGSLYKEQSMLTFETTNVVGAQNIVQHLLGLNFNSVKHVISTVSVQPSGVPGALLVSVQGELSIDNDSVMKFNQVFHLLPEGGSFWVHNDIFRLNLA